jgi:hypothetical protein
MWYLEVDEEDLDDATTEGRGDQPPDAGWT